MGNTREELVLSISGDAGGGKRAVQELAAEIKAAQKNVEDIQKAFAGVGPGANGAAVFQQELGAAQKKVADLQAQLQQTAPVVKAFGGATEDASDRLKNMAGALGSAQTALHSVGTALTAAITVPLVGAAAAATAFATEFESNTVKIHTLSGVTEADMHMMRQAILDMAPAVGIGPGELAKAMLAVTSTGITGAAAVEVLSQAARASAVGLGDATTIARTLTAIIQAYGKENITAAQAAEVMFKTVKDGNAEASELAGSLGRVIGIASQVGVSFDQVGTFIATFTRLGVSSAEAVTSLRSTLSEMIKPSKGAQEALATVGLTFADLRAEIREKGLTAALIDLMQHFKGHEEVLANVIPNIRALAGVMGTAGAQAGAMAQIQDHLRASTHELDEAFVRTQQTTAFTFKELKAQIEVVAIKFGDALLPAFRDVVKVLRDDVLPTVKWLAEAFAGLPEPARDVVIAVAAITAAVGPSVYVAGSLAGALGNLIKLSQLPVFAGLISSLQGIGTAALGSTAFVAGLQVAIVALSAYAVYRAIDEALGLLNDTMRRQNEITQENITYQNALAGASKIAGREITDLAEAHRILLKRSQEVRAGVLGAKDGLGELRDGMTVTIPSIHATADATGKLGAAHLTVTEQVKALTTAQRADIDAKRAHGEATKDIAKETGIAANVIAAYLKQIHATTAGTNAYEKSVQSLLATISGEPPKVYELLDAWNRLTPAQQADADVMKNVVAAYDKMRPHLSADGMPWALEELRKKTETLTTVHQIWNTALNTSALVLPDFSGLAAVATSHVHELAGAMYDWNGALSDTAVVKLPALVSSLQKVPEAANALKDSLASTLSTLPEIFERAFEGGGGIAGALKSIAVKLGKDFGEALKKSIAQSVEDAGGSDGNRAGGLSGQSLGAAGGLGGLMGAGAASSGGSAGSQVGSVVMGGVGVGITAAATTGATLAASAALAATTMGIGLAVVGAVILIKHLLRDQMPNDIARDAGEKFGQAWSDGLKKIIVANAKAMHDEVTGELVSLPDIIKEHPIDASNVEMYTAKVRDLFVAIGTGHLTVKQAVSVLDEVFPQLAAVATDANGRISASLREIIHLNEVNGLQSKAIAAWQQGQGAAAIAGFIETLGGAAIATKQDLTDLAAQAMGAYTAAVAAGMSEAEALTKIGPALLALQQNYQDLGFEVDDVGLKTLMLQSQILTGSPKLANGIKGISDEMVALDNLGLLTVDQFAAMQRTGYGMFVQLQDQAAKLGGDSKDALLPMQAYLHQAQIEALALGVPLDANTQMLIGQSKELGIWKETGKTAADKLTDAMQTLADKVSALVDAIRGVKTGIEAIPTHTDVEIVQHFRQGDEDEGGLLSAAREGFFARPTTVRVGDDPRGEGEYVLHKSTVDRLVRQARLVSSFAVRSLGSPQLSAAGAAAASAAASGPQFHITNNVEGSVITQQELLDFLMQGLYNQASLLGGLVPAVNG